MTPGLGRRPAPDDRDAAHPMRAAIPVAPLRLTRYWNDLGWWGDQGPHPHCVGYAWAHWVKDGPVTQPGLVLSPVDLYKSARLVDEWPGEGYEGTSVRAGAKVLRAQGRISEYLWAWDATTIVEAILNAGPVVVGTNWYAGMFTPDAEDLLQPTGVVVGGHAYVLNGVNLKRGLVRVKNSWGRAWGGDGRAWMAIETLERLISEDGEACLAREIKGGGV